MGRRLPTYLAVASSWAKSMASAGGPPLVEDCGPVWVSPKTRDSDSRLHYRPAAKAVVPAIRPPEPTAAQANSVAESTAVLGRPRGRDQKATTSPPTWVNSFTCGWVSGVSSYPWTCADAWHCETNAGHAVGCVSGTYSPLYTECYDYTAWTNGLCSDTGSLTGCCESSQKPACVTYLWSGTPRRSMFRCGAVPAITSMLDAPQYVLDAASSLSASRAVSAKGSSSSSTIASPPPGTTTRRAEKTPTPSSTGADASPAAPLPGLAIAGLVVFALLLGLSCGGATVYLRWAHRRNRLAPVPDDGRAGARVDATYGTQLRDMR